MKNVFFAAVVLLFLAVSCSKREPVADNNVKELELHYDTTAIDSFSPGAVSVDVARHITKVSGFFKGSH